MWPVVRRQPCTDCEIRGHFLHNLAVLQVLTAGIPLQYRRTQSCLQSTDQLPDTLRLPPCAR